MNELQMGKLHRLMIVEDNMLIRLDLEESLSESGFTICATARSGEEAIDKAREAQPDLVLMDIGLKGEMTGIEAALILRKQLSVPIIFLSGNSDLKKDPMITQIQPIAFVVKPVDTNDLIRLIQAQDLG